MNKFILLPFAALALHACAAFAAAPGRDPPAADARDAQRTDRGAVPSNIPSAPITTTPLAASAPLKSERVSPVDPNAPRVGPPPAGQAVSDDYRIGPQDLLEIQVYGLEQLKRDVRVNSKGVVTLPLVGTLQIGGLTSQEAEEMIRAAYEKDYLRNPQVSLFIKEYTSQRITIEGAVNRPGVYPIKGQTSLLQAIAIAGGQGQLSDMTQVLLFRVAGGEKKQMKYDVVKIRAGELDDPMLVNDDVVVLNRSGARAALKDSLFRDILDTLNPFTYIRPYPYNRDRAERQQTRPAPPG
jgi:polysaccharide export outer membrane protein